MDAEKSIPSPKEIHKYFGGLFDEEKVEQLVALWINEGGKIIDVETISRGTASFTSAHPEDIFGGAFVQYSVGLVLLHNHLSGNPEPSAQDIIATKIICEAGKEIGIQVYDHIIIANDKYTSFMERGLL